MFKYPDNTYKQKLPSFIEVGGVKQNTAGWSASDWDVHGYNEAIPVKREAFTTYTTEWQKDADLILREVVLSAVVDEVAKAAFEAAARKEEILAELSALDLYLPRAIEELIEGTSPVLKEHLSSFNQDRFDTKQALRTELASL